MQQQLWLELPPLAFGPPSRLLIFLHGAGSRPETFAPIAIAWQLKFPRAVGVILQGLMPGAGGQGFDWFEGGGIASQRRGRIEAAASVLIERIETLQRIFGIGAERTVVIGFSQGATLALQALRAKPGLCAITVSYAGQLASPIGPHERLDANVHLLHGELDSIVPLVHARQALRGLQAAGSRVTLDIHADSGHTIGQEEIILGTTRVLQTIFRGRQPPRRGPGPAGLLH